MAYNLLYHHAVLREDIANLPADQKERIKNAIEKRLLPDPVLAGKPLHQSLKGHRKFRVGDYRIIYRIEKNNIIILKIGHRREVYDRAARRKK